MQGMQGMQGEKMVLPPLLLKLPPPPLLPSELKSKVEKLIEILRTNPYQNPPSYEKLN